MNQSPKPSISVLVVDDDVDITTAYECTLNSDGITDVLTCQDSREVMSILAVREVGVILLDLMMPHLSGIDLLSDLSQKFPQIPVIVITGVHEIETAVHCMKSGAFDYMVKPVEDRRLVSGVKRALELRQERKEYESFRQRVFNDDLEHPEVFAEIISRDRRMRSIFQYIETIAITRKPVLITGESGTGKELIAKAVHALSERAGDFVGINIAGLDDNFFSDTLFGHLKGAFTNASTTRQGLIEQAGEGTLFLDEIGDLSAGNQIKLLRLIEEGEYYPVGSDVPKGSTARIVASTNRDLRDLLETGQFRRDLYYRLHTHHIHVPPLRERKGDLPLLLDYFLEKASQSLGKKTPTPPRELTDLLAGYHFPGNVRELSAMVFDAVSLHTSRMLSMEVFKSYIDRHRVRNENGSIVTSEQNTIYTVFECLPTLRESRRQLVSEALRRSRNNKAAAAQILGISRSGLNKLLQRLETEE